MKLTEEYVAHLRAMAKAKRNQALIRSKQASAMDSVADSFTFGTSAVWFDVTFKDRTKTTMNAAAVEALAQDNNLEISYRHYDIVLQGVDDNGAQYIYAIVTPQLEQK